jgi:hypothetical protein
MALQSLHFLSTITVDAYGEYSSLVDLINGSGAVPITSHHDAEDPFLAFMQPRRGKKLTGDGSNSLEQG